VPPVTGLLGGYSQSLNLSRLLLTFRRTWWLALGLPALALAATYGYFEQQPKQYQAIATVLIRTDATDPSAVEPVQDDVLLTYSMLLGQPSVLGTASKKLGLPNSDALTGQITVQPRPHTALIDIVATARDPGSAAAYANAIPAAFLSQVSDTTTRESSLDASRLQEQVNAVQADVDRLTAEMASLNEKQTKYAADKTQVDYDVAVLAQLRLNLSAVLSATNTKSVPITVVTPATPPAAPTKPLRKLDLAVAGAGGLIVAAAAMLILAALDTSITSSEELAEATGSPTLAIVRSFRRTGRKRVHGRQALVLSSEEPRFADAFRKLRVALMAAEPDRRPRTVMVTSALPHEGKTSVAVNLAVLHAQSGQRVLLVEADFERPALASVFGHEGALGLSQIVSGDIDIDDALLPTRLDGLSLLAAGPGGPERIALLSSRRLEAVLDELRSRCDLLIIDTASVVSAAESAALCRWVDVVLLVVAAGRTPRDRITQGISVLRAAGGVVTGTILNQTRPGHEAYRYA
jgi:capsular exopolysaccharide synthesis family protein